MLFGLCAVLSALGARAEEGRLRNAVLRAIGTAVQGRALARVVAAIGGVLGFFVAGYTGILLSVTNRPIWADSPWLGALFVASGASTGAALLILLAPGRGASARSLAWLSDFDFRAIVFELLMLIAFLVSLGSVNRVWVSGWGLLLLIGVIGTGIVVPLGLHLRPASFGGPARPVVRAAKLVLLGGFLLRITVLLASEGIEHYRVAAGF
jgi:formate-dependent nitrite reductase membrane component NrfD